MRTIPDIRGRAVIGIGPIPRPGEKTVRIPLSDALDRATAAPQGDQQERQRKYKQAWYLKNRKRILLQEKQQRAEQKPAEAV